MSRPPRAREKVLDAFEDILLEEGERAATLDAVARRAGVSKGGLLYHFGSREALDAGLIERLRAHVEADALAIRTAPEGAVAYVLTTSADTGSAYDRAILAVSRLANGGNGAAVTALATTRETWAEDVRPHVRDEAALNLVLLVSDGLYANSALLSDVPAPVPQGEALDALIRLVEEATRP